MFFLPLILAAGSFSTLISGAPVPSFLSNAVSKVASSLSLKERGGYVTYGGTGDLSDGWPSTSLWLDFETLFTANTDNIQNSCKQWSVANPTTTEISDIKSAITSVSSSTGVDARFILAIMIQESNGCVRAPTTNYGVRNPGLMQSHDGAGTCNEGSVQSPCPASAITQMIQDGAGGTSGGDGLQQCITQSGASDDSKYYKAARIYNSGSIAATKNLGAGIATHCYSSDLANRLTGWTGTASGCDANTVGTLSGTTGGSTGGGSGSSASSAVVTIPSTYAPPSATSTKASSAVVATPTPTPSNGGGVFVQLASSSSSAQSTATTTVQTTVATSTSVSTVTSTSASSSSAAAPTSSAAAPTTTPVASPSNGTPVSTTAEKYPYAVQSCKTWYTVVANDYCILVEQKTGVSMSDLQKWNANLQDDCANLWLGYQYCVAA